MDDLFLRAVRCETTPRPPVWLMRQAGRYLKEYRDLKEKYSFLELCKQPDLASRITLLPIQKFSFDAAILFADILLILETIRRKISFGEDQGPRVEPLQNPADVFRCVPEPIPTAMAPIGETIKILKKELKVPLLGFAGAPFTLATYLIEGKTSKDFLLTKKWMYRHPEAFHRLLRLLTDQTIEYLKFQIESGVDAVQIFDSWAGILPYPLLHPFSLYYLGEIIQALKPFRIPVILFARGSSLFGRELALLRPEAISLDSSGDLLKIAEILPPEIALQGNFDPDLLIAPEETLRNELLRILRGIKNRPGYIVNLGHGVKPESRVENVRCLVETVKNMSY